MNRLLLPWRGSRIMRMAAGLAGCFCSCFTYLGAAEISLMEARNFVAACEMAAGGGWRAAAGAGWR